MAQSNRDIPGDFVLLLSESARVGISGISNVVNLGSQFKVARIIMTLETETLGLILLSTKITHGHCTGQCCDIVSITDGIDILAAEGCPDPKDW